MNRLVLFLFLCRLAAANPSIATGSGGCPESYEVALGPTRREMVAAQKPQSYNEAAKSIREEQQRWKDKGVPEEHLPFLLDHGKKAKRSIVLVHGISETPAGIKFLAEEYHKQGFNVLTVLLEGHGTTPEALNNGNVPAWRDQIDHAVKQAGSLGDAVMVGGYSFGATLALDAGIRLQGEVGGIALHSPMLQPDKQTNDKVRARLAEDKTKNPASIWTSDKADESQPGIKGFTYQRTPTVAYVNMLDAVAEMKPTWEQPIAVPVYVIYGHNDGIASPDATAQFIQQQQIPQTNVIILPNGRHDDSVRLTKTRQYPTEQMPTFIQQMSPQALAP